MQEPLENEAELLAWIEGELAPDETAKVEAVLGRDADLSRLMHQMRPDRLRLQQLEDVEPPVDLLADAQGLLERSLLLGGDDSGDRVDSSTPRDPSLRSRHQIRRRAAWGAIAATLALVTAGGVLWQLGWLTSSPGGGWQDPRQFARGDEELPETSAAGDTAPQEKSPGQALALREQLESEFDSDELSSTDGAADLLDQREVGRGGAIALADAEQNQPASPVSAEPAMEEIVVSGGRPVMAEGVATSSELVTVYRAGRPEQVDLAALRDPELQCQMILKVAPVTDENRQFQMTIDDMARRAEVARARSPIDDVPTSRLHQEDRDSDAVSREPAASDVDSSPSRQSDTEQQRTPKRGARGDGEVAEAAVPEALRDLAVPDEEVSSIQSQFGEEELGWVRMWAQEPGGGLTPIALQIDELPRLLMSMNGDSQVAWLEIDEDRSVRLLASRRRLFTSPSLLWWQLDTWDPARSQKVLILSAPDVAETGEENGPGGERPAMR